MPVYEAAPRVYQRLNNGCFSRGIMKCLLGARLGSPQAGPPFLVVVLLQKSGLETQEHRRINGRGAAFRRFGKRPNRTENFASQIGDHVSR